MIEVCSGRLRVSVCRAPATGTLWEDSKMTAALLSAPVERKVPGGREVVREHTTTFFPEPGTMKSRRGGEVYAVITVHL